MKIQLVHNVITTSNMDACVDFYTRHFGFEVVADAGFYKHLRAAEGVELAFMQPDHSSQPALYQPEWRGQGLIITLQVADVRGAYAAVNEAGLPIAFELKREDWGQTHFGVRDPNGIPVDIVQYDEAGSR